MDIFLVPLANTPQRFEIDLGGTEYTIQCRWNQESLSWIVDVWRADTDEQLFSNFPLLAGADLLEQFQHLIRGSLYIYTDGDENADPTHDNLGNESNLFFIP